LAKRQKKEHKEITEIRLISQYGTVTFVLQGSKNPTVKVVWKKIGAEYREVARGVGSRLIVTPTAYTYKTANENVTIFVSGPRSTALIYCCSIRFSNNSILPLPKDYIQTCIDTISTYQIVFLLPHLLTLTQMYISAE
jgi:hypothetical protein